MKAKIFIILFFAFAAASANNAPKALSLMLSARNLGGCFDTIAELPCDAKIHIWYNTNIIIPNWRILASTPVIMNNNNPVWPTPYPIPSDTTQLKFQVVDVDFGIDDILGDTPPLKVEEILDGGAYFDSPIGGGEGSGVVRITPKF